MKSLRWEDFMSVLRNPHQYQTSIAGMCPFEEHASPALLVFKDGWYRCLSCGRHGNWIMLWNKLHGQNVIARPDPKVAYKGPSLELDMEEMCYQAHEDIMQFSSYQWYLEDRGLLGRLELNEIGYWEGWYTFPVMDDKGNFITSVFRSLPHVQKATNLRYICRHAPVPYVPDHALVRKSPYLFVVYGIFDALTLADMRFPVMTSTAGAKSFNPEWVSGIRKPIYIIPDKGEEQQAYDLAKLLDVRGKVILLDFPDGKKDCNGFYEAKKGESLLRQLTNVL